MLCCLSLSSFLYLPFGMNFEFENDWVRRLGGGLDNKKSFACTAGHLFPELLVETAGGEGD